MNTNLYMIRDNVAETLIGQIVQAKNDKVAARDFFEALGNKDSTLNRHPEDYDLVYIGFIDEADVLNPGDYHTAASGSEWAAEQRRKIGPNAL